MIFSPKNVFLKFVHLQTLFWSLVFPSKYFFLFDPIIIIFRNFLQLLKSLYQEFVYPFRMVSWKKSCLKDWLNPFSFNSTMITFYTIRI